MSNFLSIVNGYPRLVSESASTPIYDQSVVINSTITAGTNYTLPLGGTYSGDELEVMLDGQVLDSGSDFNFVGSGSSKTQVQFTFDLLAGDNLRFRKIRGP